MSFVYPWALLALPALLAWAVWVRRQPASRGRLPGAWHRVVARELRAHVATLADPDAVTKQSLPLCIAVLVCLALARPVIDRGNTPDFANLVGRVLILDLSGAADMAAQRIAVQELVELAPDVPTGLVAVTGQAWQIVPLTTDAAHMTRYLAVLTPDIVPDPGRALFRGLVEADRILERADIAAGQSILISAGAPPVGGVTSTAAVAERLILPLERSAEWERFARDHDAALLRRDALPGSVARLRSEARSLVRRETPGAVMELAPFVIAVAAGLWLGLFRAEADA